MWEKTQSDNRYLIRAPNGNTHRVITGIVLFYGDYIKGSLLEETELAFQNFFATLEATEFSPDEIVFVDIAFDDLTDVNVVNQLYVRLFPEGRRLASTIYEVQALPIGGKIIVLGTAVKTDA